MNVLLASDNNYTPLLGVTLYSLLESNEKDFENIDIFVLDSGINNENKVKLQNICDKFDIDTSLNFIEINNIEAKLGIKIKATISLASYSRLFAASLIDDSIDKILYLDCDALVVDSLINLWETDLKDNYCGAVLDAGPEYNNTYLDLPKDAEHYNAGLLLINLRLWREAHLEKKFLDYLISKNGEVFHNDQGILNVICKGRILKLDPKYNIISPFFEVGYDKVLQWYGIEKYYNKEMVDNAVKNPVFIHLVQFVYGRPWFKNATNHPLRKLFDSYVEKTEFKNEVYIEDNRHFRGKFLSFTYKILPYSVVCKMFGIYRFIITTKLNNNKSY